MSPNEATSVQSNSETTFTLKDALGTLILGIVALVCIGGIIGLTAADKAIPTVLETLAATAVGGSALAAPPQLLRRR